ncbi:MAG: TetR/AcrR family transcriptional regulator, partial [Thermoactinomyces sp.]
GYDQASTNRIIREASISKGLLFHYFGSKKQLFLATFDYCVNQYTNEINRLLPPSTDLPTDFFERILFRVEAKFRYFLQHPTMYSFLLTAYDELLKKFPDEAEKRLNFLEKIALSFMIDGIDRSKFRPGLDIEKVVSFIFLSLNAFTQRWIRQVSEQPEKGIDRWEAVLTEYKMMLDILKHGVYRNSGE